MSTTQTTVKLSNSSPFPISVERLIKLYSDIKAKGILPLECLTSVEPANIATEHVLSTTANSHLCTPDQTMKHRSRSSEDSSPVMNHSAKPRLSDNSVLKRSRDPFDIDTEQNEHKHFKLARSSTNATKQKKAGEFKNVLASLNSSQNYDTESNRSPLNSSLPSRPDCTASNVRMDFEDEATSPTGIKVDIQDTMNHIKDI